MAQLERDYTKHLDYFFNGTLHIAPEHLSPPGFQNYANLLQMSQAAPLGNSTGSGPSTATVASCPTSAVVTSSWSTMASRPA